MQNKNNTLNPTMSTHDLMMKHHVKVKGQIGVGLSALTVDGEEFSFETCRPGYANLISTKTNKVLAVVPADITIHDAIELCVQAIAEEEVKK